jgi:hypothetical protein
MVRQQGILLTTLLSSDYAGLSLVVSSSEVWIGNLQISEDSVEGILFQTVVALTTQLSVVCSGVEPFEQLRSND